MSRLLITGGSGFIGTEVIKIALEQGFEILNLDVKAPYIDLNVAGRNNQVVWIEQDVRDPEGLIKRFADFEPELVMHLASDIDVSITQLSQFTTTINGTQNVVDAVRATPSVRRFMHTSTQFAVMPGVVPVNETFLQPYTVYGEAKAETEKIVRGAGLETEWLIVRPTIIWGPNHPSFAQQIFRHIAQRTYLHPKGRQPILRAFGYVRNTAQQMFDLTTLPKLPEDRKMFYLGDETLDYDVWADAFSLALTQKKARRIPMSLLKGLGLAGDVINAVGLRSPIDSGRAFRMSTSSAISLKETHQLTSTPRVSFEQGVKETLEWLNAEYAKG